MERRMNHEEARELVNNCMRHVRLERIRQGMSQRTLAGLAGIDHSTVHLLETGKRNPTLSVVLLLYDALGLPLLSNEIMDHKSGQK